MAYVNDIEGKYVTLKSVTIEDAEFTLKIRQDQKYVKFIPRLNITVLQQENWISKQRETDGDYFFVVWAKNGEPIGTIGVYETDSEIPKGGRLILAGDAFENSEAQYLLFKFAFEILNLKSISGFIYSENKRAIRFNKQFGVLIEKPILDEENRMISLTKITAECFKERIPLLKKLIYHA